MFLEDFLEYLGAKKHLLLFHAGWDGFQIIYGALIHIDIIGDKIWIQYDATEDGVANTLVELGFINSARKFW